MNCFKIGYKSVIYLLNAIITKSGFIVNFNKTLIVSNVEPLVADYVTFTDTKFAEKSFFEKLYLKYFK